MSKQKWKKTSAQNNEEQTKHGLRKELRKKK